MCVSGIGFQLPTPSTKESIFKQKTIVWKNFTFSTKNHKFLEFSKVSITKIFAVKYTSEMGQLTKSDTVATNHNHKF